MSNSTYLKEIKINDKEFYYVLASVDEQTFNFITCKGLQIYRGTLNAAEIEKNSAQLNISGKSIRDMILQFFTQSDVADMLIELVKSSGDDDVMTLKFKKILDRKMNVRAQLCSVQLQPSDEAEEDLGRILHFSVNQLDKKTDTLTKAENELKQTQNELQTMLDKMAALVAEKSEIEHKLFANFALVLNEKKRKIDSLQDELTANGSSATADHARNDSQSDDDWIDSRNFFIMNPTKCVCVYVYVNIVRVVWWTVLC